MALLVLTNPRSVKFVSLSPGICGTSSLFPEIFTSLPLFIPLRSPSLLPTVSVAVGLLILLPPSLAVLSLLGIFLRRSINTASSIIFFLSVSARPPLFSPLHVDDFHKTLDFFSFP
mmetsp:Transcript_20692/g.52389  ORF Transcript_20692/g.52389 Transcript_20692/m.52389 type:complete len:116 (+) Transcript_20692:497-844(+)